MQQKLKAVFRSPSKKQSRSSDIDGVKAQNSATTPQYTSNVNQQRKSLEEGSSQQTSRRDSRSRPLSSVYDSNDISSTGNSHNDSIANDYKSYLPALSPVHDPGDHDYISQRGHRSLIEGQSDGRHEEDVADRNIDRHRSSIEGTARKSSSAPLGNSSSSENSTKRYSVGKDFFTQDGLVDTIASQPEARIEKNQQSEKSSYPSRSSPKESHLEQNRSKFENLEKNDKAPSLPPKDIRRKYEDNVSDVTTTKELDGQDDIAKQITELLDSAVDLRDTVDTDKATRYAPAVTHETVKPHEHEIIQHEIFREIHNYEHYHHIQPIYDLEVLPPRHWTTDPQSGQLVEISAADMPMRTGEHRMWDIVPKSLQPSSIGVPKWRTEPEIIEHPVSITPEGFQRRETTIIHPPTLQDMSDYEGLVQPVHFDHKTGKRWLGEITSMQNLRRNWGRLDDIHSDDSLALNGLAEHLPEIPGESQVPALSPSSSQSGYAGHESPAIKRKPVHGQRVVNFVD